MLYVSLICVPFLKLLDVSLIAIENLACVGSVIQISVTCYVSVLPCEHRTFSCLLCAFFVKPVLVFKKMFYQLPLLILHVLDPLFWLWYVTFQCLRNVPAVSTNKNKERKRKKRNPFPWLPLFVLISLCCPSCTLKSNVFKIWVETGLYKWFVAILLLFL